MDSPSGQEGEITETDFVEVDPTGRYGRYNEVLGSGAFKTVYKAFDAGEGIEVAWNQVKLAYVLQNAEDSERLYSEVHLLKTLKHKNIIKFYNSWVDSQNINFITEVFTSGTLRQYRKRHKHVDLRALKNWSRQILCGLNYLHSHDPPVIHRDLKCDNIFVNGNQGEVKIGDLGLAAILRHAHSAHSVIGTPEFMAPELYEEEYNELVDIYAFGMCLLELVTFEYPYTECKNAAQIYKKVASGIKPASLAKVKDPDVKKFIEKCIGKAPERLSASELLRDPFLQMDAESDILFHSTHEDQNGSKLIKLESSTSGIDCTVEGQRKDINTIFLKLRIADSTGQVHNIHFPFDIEVDTSISVAAEMVAELDLTDQDVMTIADMIETEIQVHFPDWAPGALDEDRGDDDESPLRKEVFGCHSPGNLVLERLPSGRKYWSDSPKRSSSSSPSARWLNSPHGGNILAESVEVEEQMDEQNHGPELHKLLGESACFLSDESQTEDLSSSDTKISPENESETSESVMRRLEELLAAQQNELDDLRKRHDLAIAHALRELPLDLQTRAFAECRLKVLDCRMQSRSEESAAWKQH